MPTKKAPTAGGRGIKWSARNRQICALRKKGLILQEIADRYGVSRERIRQITSRFFIPVPERPKLPEAVTDRCCHCKKQYERKRGSTRKFCSNACRRLSQIHKPFSRFRMVKLKCDGCGVAFQRSSRLYQIILHIARERGNEHPRNFCSHACYLQHGTTRGVRLRK